MKKYRVLKTDKQKLSVNDLEWTRAEELRLEYCWASGAPRTSAYILRHESGLYVKFTSEEYPQRIEYREYNAPVNRDSCVEIFLAPDVNDTEHYINFEMNAGGYMYLGYGTKACRSAISDVDFDIFCVEVERRNDGWELMLFIPFSSAARCTLSRARVKTPSSCIRIIPFCVISRINYNVKKL